MVTKAIPRKRREVGLSREQIVEVAIVILDNEGEAALTFRTLAKQLETGLGAIYHHLTDKADLVATACDAVVVRVLSGLGVPADPNDGLRKLGLALYEAIDQHPWLGSALPHVKGTSIIRILELIGQHLVQLKVAPAAQWSTASALLHYILGVGSLNAANSVAGRLNDFNRETYLSAVADEWRNLDPVAYPFVRRIATQMRAHEDREDFLAGLDLILTGVQVSSAKPNPLRSGVKARAKVKQPKHGARSRRVAEAVG